MTARAPNLFASADVEARMGYHARVTDRRLDPQRIHTRLSEPQREALARHPEGGAHDVSWMHWGSWKVLRSAGLLAGESRFESTLTGLGLAARRIELRRIERRRIEAGRR